LRDLELLSADERAHLLGTGNTTTWANLPFQPIHELVEVQAASQPDAMALVVEEHHLTYGVLNGRANRLAQHLQRLGVGPEVLVGLYVERSPELLVGLLGILKAGGAYVPLDPVLPRARLADMVEEAQPLVLLTQERLRESLPAPAAQVVCLDSNWEAIER